MKTGSIIIVIQETDIKIKDGYYLRVKGRKRVLKVNRPKKQAGAAILLSNKIDFQPKLIKGEGERHFILIKEKNPSR